MKEKRIIFTFKCVERKNVLYLNLKVLKDKRIILHLKSSERKTYFIYMVLYVYEKLKYVCKFTYLNLYLNVKIYIWQDGNKDMN